ncbi:MAG: GntR family transcriptional regulator [Rhodobacteraceae bacterium]|nr:GntR family transcriptional regulator [Paracoccaceae bacterium]MCY4139645.1 GntR family transcriptional regulator [Paracoccaceae bacterium]
MARTRLATTESSASKSRRGALQVHESLREDILWLRIEPGSALDEVALAERFEVSRTPIREALLLLSGEGLVKFLPNRTTIVAPMLMDNAGDYHDTLLILSRSVARTAAMSGRADGDLLFSHIDRSRAAVRAGDMESILRADHAFLRHLAALSGNIFLERFIDQILDAGVRMYVLHYFRNAAPDELHQSVEQMAELSYAILDGDPDRSDQRVSEMIQADIAIIMRSLAPRVGQDMKMTSSHVARPHVSNRSGFRRRLTRSSPDQATEPPFQAEG